MVEKIFERIRKKCAFKYCRNDIFAGLSFRKFGFPIGICGLWFTGFKGLEYRFNKHLLDFKGIVNAEKTRGKVFEGGKIFLTIDENIQYFAEKELKAQVEKMKASRGQVIVMESKTASILAMANYPNYNPNNFSDYSLSTYLNRAVNAAYEPGSTFKVITLAAALEEKLINPQQKIYCENGSFFIGGSVIRDVKPYAYLKLHEVLQKSSNICALKIGRLIKNKKFHQYILDFGFGKKTNIELPGEIYIPSLAIVLIKNADIINTAVDLV